MGGDPHGSKLVWHTDANDTNLTKEKKTLNFSFYFNLIPYSLDKHRVFTYRHRQFNKSQFSLTWMRKLFNHQLRFHVRVSWCAFFIDIWNQNNTSSLSFCRKSLKRALLDEKLDWKASSKNTIFWVWR